MDDIPPPRKQLRLLAKGREKVSEILRRRRKKQDDRKFKAEPVHNDSDIEDEMPILSRIADPNACSKPSLKVRLRVKPADEGGLSLPSSTTPAADERDGSKARTFEGHEASTDQSAAKVDKRQSIVGPHRLNDGLQTAFNTEIVMAQHRPIATQPSFTQQHLRFTFNSNVSSGNKIDETPCFGPQPIKKVPTGPQLKQAARNAFLKSKAQPEHVSDEEYSSQKEGIKLQYRSTYTKEKSSRAKSPSGMAQNARSVLASETSNPTVAPRPVMQGRIFDKFKLEARNPASASRIDDASSVSNVSHFIPPKIPVPETGPEIYRSFHHKQTVAKVYMQHSLPDGIESAQFVEDMEIGSTPGKKNLNGDVPALLYDAHTERVPIGARHGRLAFRAPSAVFPGQPITQTPMSFAEHANGQKQSLSHVPENFYTELDRLSTAYLSTRQNLKRKRPAKAVLPPPSYIHQYDSSLDFNIFTNGILLYPELCLLVASQLPVQTLINLYSISKDYHVILNQRFTTVILNQATKKAPAAAKSYPWRCFANLCQPDPAYASFTTPLNADFTSRTDGANVNVRSPPPAVHEATALPGCHAVHTIKHPAIKLGSSKRRVPTFRWLHMALHREKTMHEIYWLFAARGVPLPGAPTVLHRGSFALSLHKLWFGFDIPDNTRRMAYFGSPHLITPSDLSNMLVFIVKLDMICNDPLAGEKRDSVRKLFMSSANGFDTLRSALKGEIWRNELDILRAWTRYGFQLDREGGQERAMGGGWVPLGLSQVEHAMSDSVFGIPRDEVGLLKREFWGKMDYDPISKVRKEAPLIGRKTMYLMRPDQIVLREAIRRGMRMGKQFLRGLMFGYVDEGTLNAIGPRDLNGGRCSVLEDEAEYGVDDLVGGVRALAVEDGGDPLLDLGDPWEGSALTVKKVGARKQVQDMQKAEKERLEGYRNAWKENVEKERAKRTCTGFTYVDH